jgi:hypothetical protein
VLLLCGTVPVNAQEYIVAVLFAYSWGKGSQNCSNSFNIQRMRLLVLANMRFFTIPALINWGLKRNQPFDGETLDKGNWV